MKHCSHCKEFKDRSKFYKNKSEKDGLNHNCRLCESKRNIVRSKYLVDLNKRPNAKVNQRRGWKKWYQKNREQFYANLKLTMAIKKGKLTKQPCNNCEETKVEGHHFNYKKALEVMWLCKNHHEDLHHPLRKELKYGSATV